MRDNVPLFTTPQWNSIRAAIRQETAKAQEGAGTIRLEIDGRNDLGVSAQGYKYRLLMSFAPRLLAEQVVAFSVRGDDPIKARVIEARDQELVVICEKALPVDAKILQLQFSPRFIYEALEHFLDKSRHSGARLARCIVSRQLPPPGLPCQTSHDKALQGLNPSQKFAAKGILSDDMHFLWGPPGTGKTTTLASAVVTLARLGQSVLLLSNSNTAVDVVMNAVLKQMHELALGDEWLCRIGASEDPVISRLQQAGGSESKRVFGCTLAKMVLDRDVQNRRFDYVMLDEASMASVLYAIAAACLKCRRIVFSGDPMQLPPVCQGESLDARQWFGESIYEWFKISLASISKARQNAMSFLDTQYRMSKNIRNVVSRTAYGGRLRGERGDAGLQVEFLEIPREWERNFYAPSHKSYYHPLSAVVLHEIVACLPESCDVLMLSPFRPQQALLAAVGFDLSQVFRRRTFGASTIHRAQGDERQCVILDLTTHDPARLSRFFVDQSAERLVNVAISRAQERLIIIGSKGVLHRVAEQAQRRTGYWKELILQFGAGIQDYAMEELFELMSFVDVIEKLRIDCTDAKPSLYSSAGSTRQLAEICELANELKGCRKVVVGREHPPVVGKCIGRKGDGLPELILGGDRIALPLGEAWVSAKSPSVCRVLWRVGFSHVVEPESTLSDLEVFSCPRCGPPGSLVIGHVSGLGVRLVCEERSGGCYYDRPLSVREARAKVRAQDLTCGNGHPATVRSGPKGLFLACENYPACEWTGSIRLIEGI